MSGNAVVAYNTVPTVVTNPVNASVLNNGTTSFTASFSGTPTPTIQWQVSTTGASGPWTSLTNAAPYSGVTTGTLTINPAVISMNGNYYRSVGTNGCTPAANTTAALLTVISPGPTASVLSLSGASPICSGAGTSLKVTITGGTSPFTVVYSNGTTNFTVSNYVSGTNIPVSPTATTTYSLVSVTDANMNAGTGNSGTATVTINPSPTVIASPGTQTICSGSAIAPIILTGQLLVPLMHGREIIPLQ